MEDEKTKTCKKCGKTFDPMYDIVEDYDLLMSVDYFTDVGSIQDLCPGCIYELSDLLCDTTKNWEIDIK